MQVPEKPRNLDGIAAQELARNKAYWERRSPIYRRTETQEAIKSTFQRKSTLPTEERLREIRLEEQQRRWFNKVHQHLTEMQIEARQAEIKRIKIGTIINVVCDVCRVNKNILLSPAREREYIIPRAAIVMIAREQGRSFPQIGRMMNRDHSSIIHLYKKYGNRSEVLDIIDRVKPRLAEDFE